MNSRAALFGLVGVVTGLFAGVLVDRKLIQGPATPGRSDTIVVTAAPPASTFKPLQPREVSAGAPGKSTGRLTLAELPAALERALNESQMNRYASLLELANRVDITLVNMSVLKNNRARAIRFSTLEALCKVLDCQPGDLMTYE